MSKKIIFEILGLMMCGEDLLGVQQKQETQEVLSHVERIME